MAIIVPSALISSIRGKMNGSVFQNSSNGNVMRSKPNPVGAGSKMQNTIKVLNNNLNYYWEQLTDNQRTQWQAFAAYENSAVASGTPLAGRNSGKQMFMSVNFYILFYDKPILNEPVFANSPTPAAIVAVTSLAGAVKAVMDIVLPNTTELQILKLSQPQSTTTNTTRKGIRLMHCSQNNAADQATGISYKAAFGIAPSVGQRVWIETARLNYLTGMATGWDKQLITVS